MLIDAHEKSILSLVVPARPPHLTPEPLPPRYCIAAIIGVISEVSSWTSRSVGFISSPPWENRCAAIEPIEVTHEFLEMTTTPPLSLAGRDLRELELRKWDEDAQFLVGCFQK